MEVTIGPIVNEYAEERDDNRIHQAELRHQAASEEGRTARRRASAAQQAFLEKEEGPLYGPGIEE